MAECKWCGEDCSDDFFLLDLKRIKDRTVYIPSLLPTVILCLDCYEKLRESAAGLNL